MVHAPAPGQSPGNVARVVESKGGNVTGQKALSPIDGIFEAFRFAVAPRQVKPGAQVELLTDPKGNVVGYQPIAEVRIEKTIEKTVERVVEHAGPEVAMKADLEALSGKLAEREQLVAKLSTDLAELQRRSSEDTVRKADFEALSRKLADRESVITKLATDFNELQRRHAEELKSLGGQMNEFGRLLRERPPR